MGSGLKFQTQHRVILNSTAPPRYQHSEPLSQPAPHPLFPKILRTSTMTSIPQQSKRRDGALSTLDAYIQAVNLAKDTCGIPLAQAAFASASALLTMIRVRSPTLQR